MALGYGAPGELNKHSDVCEKIGNNVTVINTNYAIYSDINQICNQIIKDITVWKR
jgi:hypothetical protein